jgi:probable HAF family extracellular repeat protein
MTSAPLWGTVQVTAVSLFQLPICSAESRPLRCTCKIPAFVVHGPNPLTSARSRTAIVKSWCQTTFQFELRGLIEENPSDRKALWAKYGHHDFTHGRDIASARTPRGNMKSRSLVWITTITLLLGLAIRLGWPLRDKINSPMTMSSQISTLGGTFGEANAVSNTGSVAGDAKLLGDTVSHAFLWRKGLIKDLDTLGGPNSRATSLTEEDEVTGFSDASTPDPLGEDFCLLGTNLICLPFVWQDGAMVPLPILGGSNGQAFAVNSRGQVAGMAETETLDATCESGSEFPQVEPVLWEKGEIHKLPTIAGDPDGAVHAINDNGQAVGNTLDCTGSSFHAVRWQDGKAIDLGTLDGLLLAPQAINNRGQVAGFAVSQDGSVLVAFLWQNGVATNLGALPPDVFSLALGINNKGQV